MPVVKQRAFSQPAARRRGVVIAAVLMVLAVTSTIGVSLLEQGRTGHLQLRNEADEIEARLVLDSALERGLAALGDPDDAMLPRLRTLRPVIWTWEGWTVTFDLDAESGKVDLNAGEPELLMAAIHHVLGPSRAAGVMERLLSARGVERHIHHIEEVLAPLEAMDGSAGRLRRLVTTFTGNSGLDPASMEAPIRTALARAQGVAGTDRPIRLSAVSPERPIYSLQARLVSRGGRTMARAVTLYVDASSGEPMVVSWGDASPLDDEDNRP